MCHVLDCACFPGLVYSPYDRYYKNKIANFQEAMNESGDNPNEDLVSLIAWHAYLMQLSAFPDT